jgi:hypothetical protein
MTSEKMSVVDSTLPAPTFEFVGDLDDLTLGNMDQDGAGPEACTNCVCGSCFCTGCTPNCTSCLCTG